MHLILDLHSFDNPPMERRSVLVAKSTRQGTTLAMCFKEDDIYNFYNQTSYPKAQMKREWDGWVYIGDN